MTNKKREKTDGGLFGIEKTKDERIMVSFIVIARTDFTIMFSEFEYTTGSICKPCYHANAKQVKAI